MARHAFCDGIARRDFLRVGTAGLFGLTLPALLERQARAADKGLSPKDVSLIFLFLHGGLSTIDTWDLKPDAPAEFRGDFKPIDTNVSGVADPLVPAPQLRPWAGRPLHVHRLLPRRRLQP